MFSLCGYGQVGIWRMNLETMKKCLLLILCLARLFSSSLARDSITSGSSIGANQTLVSAGGFFELGFFTPDASSQNRYLGIWFKNIPVQTVVWVANRESPVTDSTCNLTIGSNGSLILQNGSGTVLWSTASSKLTNPVAQLLDSGNFVLKDVNSGSESLLWQSFDYPSDTLLPGMKLGWNLKTNLDRYLTTWKGTEDPSPGEYSFKLDLQGSPEFYIWNHLNKIYRNGPWMGYEFSGEPEMKANTVFSFDFVSDSDEIYYTYRTINASIISRFVLNQSMIQRYVWIDSQASWFLYWSMPRDQCDYYAECGPYGVCNSNDSPVCDCLRGFRPRNPQNWNMRDGSNGCLRTTPLQCPNGDGFLKMSGMKLPDTSNTTVDQNISLEECRLRCLANCSCVAYSSANISSAGESGCITWEGDLIDLRQFVDNGDDLYIRLAASELDSKQGNSENNQTVIVIIVIIAAVILLLGASGCCILKKKLKRYTSSRAGYLRSEQLQLSFTSVSTDHCADDENSRGQDLDLPLFHLHTLLSATNNLSNSNKLGEGGFGTVYKGELGEGKFIAVKRLSKSSLQGLEEFKNEVMLIAKLQHINLVRLLGCCIQGEERMLIYEYMHNRSLDTIIFDKSKSGLLNWQKRFNIIVGIARGLLYLHQDSRLRIIHRDLKASNILLDDDMNPKISDFGVARTFGGDGTDEYTKKLVGTLGYMSPEYAMDGIFSVKSDVFSFGVLVLEIISGKKNKATYYSDPQLNLLSYAWNLWKEGNSLELLDQSISTGSDSFPQILRCIQVGLLCVQERAEDRPDMSLVVLMLGEQAMQPQPKPPGLCTYRSSMDISSSTCTVNDITITTVDGR